MNILNNLQFFGAEAFGEPQGIATLGIDLKALILQLITFLLFFFLVKKFALTPIAKILEERRTKIDEGIELGFEMELEKQKLDEQINEKLNKARAEGDKIIAEAQAESGVIIRDAEAQAQRKAEAILADAHAKIEEDVARAKKGLEKEVLGIVADATEAIIHEKLDAKKDASLIERALKGARS